MLLTEFDFRSRPEFRAAREIIRTGRIGVPVLVTAQKSYRFNQRPKWYGDRALYAGTMLWIASHAIDAIWFSTGKKLVAVTGRQGNVSKPAFGTMEDHCAALFELEGGGTGIAHADYLRPDKNKTHGDDRLRVAGSEGVVEVRDRKCMLLDKDGGEEDVTNLVATKPIYAELLAAARGESDGPLQHRRLDGDRRRPAARPRRRGQAGLAKDHACWRSRRIARKIFPPLREVSPAPRGTNIHSETPPRTAATAQHTCGGTAS